LLSAGALSCLGGSLYRARLAQLGVEPRFA